MLTCHCKEAHSVMHLLLPKATACLLLLCMRLQDVWDLCWASDNPDLVALMEKGRMYVLRGSDPEEPVNSSACLAAFSDLQVRIWAVWGTSHALLSDCTRNTQKACTFSI